MAAEGPPSLVGHQLGAYQILSPLGVGGMGEVYRARDTKLGRDVAIKILPSAFAIDPERHARFSGKHEYWLPSIIHPSVLFTDLRKAGVFMRSCSNLSRATP